MPCIGFEIPIPLSNGQSVIRIEDAPEYYEEKGLAPGEAIQAAIDSFNGRDEYAAPESALFLSPSGLDPQTNCRREEVIKRFLPFTMDPDTLWEAQEGTLWHEVFENHSSGLRSWTKNEVRVPESLVKDLKDLPEGIVRCPDGKLRAEVFPGVLLRGKLDRGKLDWSEIVDHKSKRASRNDYTNLSIPNWSIQLSSYAHIVMMALPGTKVERLYVWRFRRGDFDRTKRWRKVDIPLLTKSELWSKIGTFVTEFQKNLQAAYDIVKAGGEEKELHAYIKTMPMDGEKLFRSKDGSTKCTKYCPVREVCHGIQGYCSF